MDQSTDSVTTIYNAESFWWIQIFDAMVGCLGMLMNFSLIGLILWKPRKLLKARNLIFILNLAVSDLALSSFLAYVDTAKYIYGPSYLDEAGCRLEGLFNQVFGINAILSVMLLGLDRYMIVVKHHLLATRYCLLLIFVATLVSIITGMSPWIVDKNAFVIQPSGNYCLLDLSKTNPRLDGIMNAPSTAYGIALFSTLCFYFFIIMEIRSASSGIRHFHSKITSESQPDENTMQSNDIQNASRILPVLDLRSQRNLNENSKKKWSVLNMFSKFGLKHSQSTATSMKNIDSKIEKTSPMLNKKRKSLEILLAKKTILIGATHFLMYFPFAVCSLMQMYKHKNLGTLDIVSVHFIIICPILDAMWSFLLDPQIKKKMRELKELLLKKE